MRNLTSFAPSADDLLLLPHRVSQKAKAFAYHYGLDDLFGRIRGPGSIIAEPTLSEAMNSSTVNSTKVFLQGSSATASVAADPANVGNGLFAWQSWRTAGGIFTYLSSRWAIMTLVMVYSFLPLANCLANMSLPRPSSPTEPSSTPLPEYLSTSNGPSDLAYTCFLLFPYYTRSNGYYRAYAVNHRRIGLS
jgi:hypothetical protein